MRFSPLLTTCVCTMPLAACGSGSTPQRIAPLVERSVSNATTVASFIEQQCFQEVGDLNRFEANLKASGWQARRTQIASSANPLELDVWELPHATLMRGQVVPNEVWTCAVAVKSPMTPPLGQMREAMTQAVGHRPGADGEWWWNSPRTRRLHMTVTHGVEAESKSIMLFVEVYHLPWYRSILG